ncbi:response regulator [Salidesulfovibrio brasiliensis]|uniref:response regulator n=1 Tax=Salidesulfovibrio brasiliensis TaxID=221711 RepID=UPI0006D28515|nr:response regulator [Salidesulfovibrio brasiliensis]
MSEKVLLIDDEPEFLESMGERLKLRDMDVDSSTNISEALDKLAAEQFDAIFLDLQMPGTNGIESLKMIKKLYPDLQVILLTGHASVEKGIEAMKLGAMDFIEKPADINVLSEKVKKAQAKKMILVEKATEERISSIITGKSW